MIKDKDDQNMHIRLRNKGLSLWKHLNRLSDMYSFFKDDISDNYSDYLSSIINRDKWNC